MSPQVSEPIRVLVVDDEAPARLRLTDLLGADPRIGLVIEAGNGRSAVQLIRAERPDLVFLDMQMPELTGLGVVDAVGADALPLTIFVTAHDQHAIRAFEANALDYLLKPFSDERLEAALARSFTRLDERRMKAFGQDIVRMVAARATPRHLDRLAVKLAGTTHLVRAADIDWIEGAGVYVILHFGGRSLLHRTSLAELVETLDPRQFVRIHRSTVVNIGRIVQLAPISHGEFDVLLQDGSRTRVSRTYRPQLERLLGQPL